MGLRAILAILAVVCGLGAVLYFTDETRKPATVDQIAVLEGRSLRDCTWLRWQFDNRAPIELGRAADGRFKLQEPIVDIASSAYMKQIVDTWDSAQMRAAPLVDDEQGRTRAGLTPPAFVLMVEWADKQKITIEVGAPGPLGTTRFLRAHGKIWEGGDSLLSSMEVGLDDLREHAVFRNSLAHAQELVVDQMTELGKRETLHLKMEKGEWRLLAPIQGRADAIESKRFITAVLALRVDNFAPGVAKFPEREPRIVITVKGAYGEESVKLWEQGGQLFGRLPGRDVAFSSDNLQFTQIFENAADRMRARILLPMGEGTFEELIELVVDPGQGRGDRLRMVRESPSVDWRLVEPVEFATAPTPCNEAAHALQLLVAREFVAAADDKHPRAEDARYGLQATRLTVTTRGVRDQGTTTLWFGSETTRGEHALVHTCRADEPDTVVLVQKAYVDTLRRSWLDYCALRVLQQNAAIDRIDLVHKDGNKRTFQIDNETWVQVGVPGERREVGDFVNDELRDLKGKLAVDARAASFDTPDWTLQLMRRSGDQLDTLKLWDRGGEQPLLAQAGERSPVVFELSARTTNDLRSLWK